MIGKWHYLCNFHERKVTVNVTTYDGVTKEYTFENSEAAFAAWKAITHDDIVKYVNDRCAYDMTKMNPKEAKAHGRKMKLRPDWEKIKVDVMHYVCTSKFRQNIDLYRKLINETEQIIEHTTWDKIWGVDINTGEGKNLLGIILEDIKAEGVSIGVDILCETPVDMTRYKTLPKAL